MPSFRLTLSTLRDAMVVAPVGEVTVIRDTKTTGLILRGKPPGDWTWALEKRINKVLCRSVLAGWGESQDIEAMRRLAGDHIAAFRRGEKPGKPAESNMLAEVTAALKVTAEGWRQRWAVTVRESTAKMAAADLRHLGMVEKPLLALTKGEVVTAYEARLAKVSKVTVAKEFRTLRLLWNYAAKTLPDGTLPHANPVASALGGGKGERNKLLPRVRRTGFVPLTAMPALLADLHRQQDEAGVGLNVRALAAEFLVLSGLRHKEVTDLEWAEVSEAKGTFTIPSDRSKNGVALTRHLTPRLREIIAIRRRESGKGDRWVFQSAAKAGRPVFDVSDPIAEAALAALKEARTPHDMRRSFVSAAAALGVPAKASRMLTNHLSGGDVHDDYTQVTDEQLLSAAEAIERAMLGVEETKPVTKPKLRSVK